MKDICLTREQSRRVDQIAIERYGIPGMVLMENAGRGVVDVLLELSLHSRDSTNRREVVILCGKGNNGGDGFVIARHLLIRDVPAKVILLAPPSELRGDALTNFEILSRCDMPLVNLSAESDLGAALDAEASDAVWVVDAMLGTGAKGAPREPYLSAIEWMNRQRCQRLAVDVPSGLDCDSGEASSVAVQADHTCTFVAKKIGFANPDAGRFLGQMHVVSIGVPASIIDEVLAG